MGIEATDKKLAEEKRSDGGSDKPALDLVKPDLNGDKLNVLLLIMLYMLQGIPMGIAMAIKMYMQNMKISYAEQAKFSIIDLPLSLRLLWAPLVDAAYSRRMGKRKTWLVPSQLCLGLSWLLIGSNLNNWLTSDGSHMTALTCVFFGVNILAATQDIAIDGWAITILRRENVGYASTCHTSGQALGTAFGYIFFILLESEQFCNKWLRLTPQRGGVITMEKYLYFWGFVYIVASTSLALFKREKCSPSDKVARINVVQTYKLLWKILNLQTIKKFTMLMLTYEIAFSSMGSTVSTPKFMEYGVAKEDMALVDMSLIPIKIIVPILISKFTTGPTPLKIFYKSVPFRLALGISTATLIYYTPFFVGGEIPNGYGYFFMIYETHRISRLVLSVVMYLGVQAFFSRISDPRIGGTYMSLLNTVWFFGMTTARVLALGLLNPLTIKRCSTDETNTCQSKTEINVCHRKDGGKCSTVVDGYFIEVCICTVCGLAWYMVLSKILKKLQSKEVSDWQVNEGNGHVDVPPPTAVVTTACCGGYDNEAYNLPDLVDGGDGTKRAKTEDRHG